MTPATLTPEDQRMDRITAMFEGIPFDVVVFRVADDIADDYNGGYWDYFEADGEFLYAAPSNGSFQISVPGNMFTGHVDADTFGLICTLTALGHLLMHLHEGGDYRRGERINKLFFKVREYALEHEKASTIMQAID